MAITELAALDESDIAKIAESISPAPSLDYQAYLVTQLKIYNRLQELGGYGSIVLYENLVKNSEEQSIIW